MVESKICLNCKEKFIKGKVKSRWGTLIDMPQNWWDRKKYCSKKCLLESNYKNLSLKQKKDRKKYAKEWKKANPVILSD